MEIILNLLNVHQEWLWLLAALSMVTFFGTLLAVPLLVIRLPEDYFAPRKRLRITGKKRPHLWGVVLLTGKNILGGLFIIMGTVMLMTPGQGILTILIGIVLLDFPGKFRLERRLVSYRPVMQALNAIRRKARRPPLFAPE